MPCTEDDDIEEKKIDVRIEALKVGISVWSSRDNQDKNVHLSQENPVKNVQ